jgi:uncharacterized protein YlxW (UPF0749 family)
MAWGSRERRTRWSWGTPVVFLASGALLMVSALNSEGNDLRPERSTDLSSVVSQESHEAEALQQRVAQLHADVQRLTDEVNDPAVDQTLAQVGELKGPAGLEPVDGKGITVTLADSPEEVRSTSKQPLNLLVVHQQDIQSVVNAMWLGGAKAVTIQGQRVISTTGIKCSGNVVRLHGIPYGQPYVISAVGDQGKLYGAIIASKYLQVYRDQSAQPDVQIGWNLELDDHLRAPGYNGLLDLSYAKAINNG